MRRLLNFIAGSICGALVGASLAILLAPSSGDELRIRARERLDAFREEIRQAYETRVAQLEADLEALRHPQAQE